MDKLDEVVVVDGVQYTQRELDVLREFAGRDTIGPTSKNPLNAFLGINDNGNENINAYLAKGIIPRTIDSREELQDFLSKTETLYSIACKYGASHDFPRTSLYREEQFYHDIVGNYDYRTDLPRKREWVSEAFKSFSKSRSETDAFSKGEFGSHKIVITEVDKSAKGKIPFIDVNGLLGREHVFADEKEFLLPPYQMFSVSPDSSIVARNPRNFRSPENDFELKITPQTRSPYTVSKQKSDGNDIHTYSSKSHDVSDAELELIVELNKKANNRDSSLTPEESITLGKLIDKLKTYTMTRCRSIYKMQMEHPLVVGKYVTKEAASRYGGIFSATDTLRERQERIVTKEDIEEKNEEFDFYYSFIYRRANYENLKNYTIVDESTGFLPQMLTDALDSGHRAGNAEMVRELAEKGLVLDDVLAYKGKITPKGLDNLGYLHAATYGERGKAEPILLEDRKKTEDLLDLDIFLIGSIYDLEKEGFTVLQDDDPKTKASSIARDSLARIGKTKRSSEIADDYGKFVEHIDRDGLVQLQFKDDSELV